MTKTKQKNLFRSVHTTACSVCFTLYAKNRADDSQPDQRILYVYAMINIVLYDKQSKSLRTLLVCFSIT